MQANTELHKEIANIYTLLSDRAYESVDADLPEILNQLRQLLVKYQPIVGSDELFNVATDYYKQGNVLIPETICRMLRKLDPQDFNSTYLLGNIAKRLNRYEDAVDFLSESYALKPNNPALKLELAEALLRSGNYILAQKECDALLEVHPEHIGTLGLLAEIKVKTSQYDEAEKTYSTLRKLQPNNPSIQLRQGQLFRILGKKVQATSLFKSVINSASASSNEAWWQLASLSPSAITDDELSKLEASYAVAEGQGKVFLAFSLGRIAEHEKDYSKAFNYFASANGILKTKGTYSPDAHSRLIDSYIQYFTDAEVDSQSSVTVESECTPIFIVGLPRTGSTLVEQILASHSLVDATQELSEIPSMVKSLSRVSVGEQVTGFPTILNYLSTSELQKLGQEYQKRTEIYRRSAAYFTDKTPHNFLYIGLIKSILPNAKIINVHRNPRDTGVSIYKQYFAEGFSFTNNLYDIGRYYVDYKKMMAHWEAVYPKHVYTVEYADLIEDTEQAIRSLLEYCGLEFEEACLNFHSNERPVATISSEQVRRPIYSSSEGYWKNFAGKLGELEKGLS